MQTSKVYLHFFLKTLYNENFKTSDKTLQSRDAKVQ